MTAGRALAERMFAALAAATADPPGVTRVSYGRGEQFAHDLARAEAEALGCDTRADAAGNLYMTLPGRDRDLPCLLTGSHLDSVPHGGNFDGAAGVIAGLGLVAELRARRVTPARDLTVVAFRAEEAAHFPLSYPGSYAMLGRLDPTALEARRADSGRTLDEHMCEAGFDAEAVRRGEPGLTAERIAAFVEVHIEQGPVLIGEGVPVGLVTAVNGGFRHTRARAVGAWAHAGATPRRFRQDAMLAVANLATLLEVSWDRIEAGGKSATITFGTVATDPAMHGGSRVAGEVAFTLDLRSEFPEVLDGLRADLARHVAAIRAARGVAIELGPEFTWPVARMDSGLLNRLEAAAGAAGVRALRLPSGAGHDAAAVAEAEVPTAMIFVRNANGSHNPDEAMELADLDMAVALLAAFVCAEAGTGGPLSGPAAM